MMRTLSTVIGLLGLSIQDLHNDLFVALLSDDYQFKVKMPIISVSPQMFSANPLTCRCNEKLCLHSLWSHSVQFPIMAMILLFSFIALKRFYYEHCFYMYIVASNFCLSACGILVFWLGLVERSRIIQYLTFRGAII